MANWNMRGVDLPDARTVDISNGRPGIIEKLIRESRFAQHLPK
jgi:hypothetical protein